jgi:DNA-binding ferritin-like protein (Dps family)
MTKYVQYLHEDYQTQVKEIRKDLINEKTVHIHEQEDSIFLSILPSLITRFM